MLRLVSLGNRFAKFRHGDSFCPLCPHPRPALPCTTGHSGIGQSIGQKNPALEMDTLICVGGAGGIGSACSRLFASRGNWPSLHCSASRLPLQRADERAGWRVCVLDTAESLGAALAEELGPCAFFHAIDVGSEISVVAAFSAALSFSEGRLDALIVMSAKFLYGEVHTIDAEQWADVCRINLAGPAL